MEALAGLPKEERLQLEAELLHSLWYDGAASIARLERRLARPSVDLAECLDDLMSKNFVYLHWPSPESPVQSVYYLTTRLRKKIATLLQDSSRQRMKVFWELLCREEEGLPNREIFHVPSA